MVLCRSARSRSPRATASKIVPASPWGPNDQTGATNRVTPAVTKAAAAEIQTGKVIAMSYPLVDGVPLFGSPLHQDHPDRDQPRPGRRRSARTS